jgi:hypothetical protein
LIPYIRVAFITPMTRASMATLIVGLFILVYVMKKKSSH